LREAKRGGNKVIAKERISGIIEGKGEKREPGPFATQEKD